MSTSFVGEGNMGFVPGGRLAPIRSPEASLRSPRGCKKSTQAVAIVPSTVMNRRPCRPGFLWPVSFGAVMLSPIRRTAHRQGAFIVGSRNRG